MTSGAFRVALSGKTLPGTSAEQAVQGMVTTFLLPLERARSLIGRPVVVKRDIDEATASAYVATLRTIGVDAYSELAADLPCTEVPDQSVSSEQSQFSDAPSVEDANDFKRGHFSATQTAGIDEFLRSIGLSHLAPLLARQLVTSAMLSELTDDDLRSMGIDALGERKRVLGAVRELKERENAKQASAINEEMRRAGRRASRNLRIVYAVVAVLTGLAFVDSDGMAGFLVAGLITFGVLWIYFLPTQIAFRNQIEHRWAVLVCNLFFGATFFGWIILLVLAKRWVTAKTAATVGVIGAIAGRM